MDVDKLFAAPETPTIDGKQYTLAPLTGDDWAKIDKRIVSGRVPPEEAVAKLAPLAPPDVAEKMFSKAYNDAIHINRVTIEQESEWLDTLAGMQYAFFLSITRAHPDITEDTASELLAKSADEFMGRVVEHLQKRFPEATKEQIYDVAVKNESAATAALIASIKGMPAENPTTPATTPG